LIVKGGVRYPVVAGYFYPDNPVELRSFIKKLFLHPHGPGKEPVVSSVRRKNTVGYIAPHAGYIYSGPVAAHTYLSMAEDGKPDSIIIIGTNHTGLGALVSVYPSGYWSTPLGETPIDSELAKAIVDRSELAELDMDAHLEEHSIEVQLPFIQYVFGEKTPIVPIVVGLHSLETARDLSRAIIEAVKETGRDTLIIVSSDLNHYDPYDITVEKDRALIDKILNLDTEGFYRTLVEKHVTACGPGGIMTLIEIAKQICGENVSKAKLLKYANSGDISGDKSTVVGYASIMFYCEK